MYLYIGSLHIVHVVYGRMREWLYEQVANLSHESVVGSSPISSDVFCVIKVTILFLYKHIMIVKYINNIIIYEQLLWYYNLVSFFYIRKTCNEY